MQLHEFISFHKDQTDGQRLGQRFVNTYMRKNRKFAPDETFRPWNRIGIFNEPDDRVALAEIQVWLLDNSYFCGDLPAE